MQHLVISAFYLNIIANSLRTLQLRSVTRATLAFVDLPRFPIVVTFIVANQALSRSNAGAVRFNLPRKTEASLDRHFNAFLTPIPHTIAGIFTIRSANFILLLRRTSLGRTQFGVPIEANIVSLTLSSVIFDDVASFIFSVVADHFLAPFHVRIRIYFRMALRKIG